MNDPVLATGGTGFIGSHIVEELVDHDLKVKVLARKSSSTKFIDHLIDAGSIEIIIGDLTDPGSLKGAADGIGTVFHVAALSSDWGERKDFDSINVNGTKNIFEECKRAGVEHLIYISTCGVIGEEDQKKPKGEASEYKPKFPYFLHRILPSGMNHYRETKMKGERAVIDLCSSSPVRLTVARPVWVYGERELHSGPYILTKEASKGRRSIPGRPDTLFHMVYVKDLSRALMKLMERKGHKLEIYMIGPEKPLSLEEYHSGFMKAVGNEGPRYVSRALTYPLGLLLELAYTIFRVGHPPLLTRARVNMGFFNNFYNTSKYRRDFGEFEETPLQIGIERSIEWWRENGYL